jgi:DNA-binding MarR family transcriptional regulator
MRKLPLIVLDDIPKNALYVIGGLARDDGAHPLAQLIEELRLSKQAAGQLVDTLVTRGYLKREVDSEDRRRLSIELTEWGRAAAKVLTAAAARVDEELRSRIGLKAIECARRALFVLVDIGRKMANQEETSMSVTKGNATLEIVNGRKVLHVQNSDLAQSRFSDVKLAASSFDDVNMQGTTFTNINLGNASFEDVDLTNVSIKNAKLTGMKIDDVLVSELIRVYQKHSK